MKIGFLGLGIMGTAMAANLVKGGMEVTVWNRSFEKTRPLKELGARSALSPAEVVAASDITFAMLADPQAAEAVCIGPDGVLAAMTAGKGYVDMSTVDSDTSRRIGVGIRGRGGRFLEAPVSGSKKPAEDGTLVILAAGDRELYDNAMPALQLMGKKILFLGETGNGARMKLVVNMVMGEMVVALSEGLSLAAKAGLQTGDLLDVLDAGAMANPLFRMKGPSMAAGDFPTAFPLKHMQKDLRLAVALGDEVGQPLPGAATANELYKRARTVGLADADMSAVIQAVK